MVGDDNRTPCKCARSGNVTQRAQAIGFAQAGELIRRFRGTRKIKIQDELARIHGKCSPGAHFGVDLP